MKIYKLKIFEDMSYFDLVFFEEKKARKYKDLKYKIVLKIKNFTVKRGEGRLFISKFFINQIENRRNFYLIEGKKENRIRSK